MRNNYLITYDLKGPPSKYRDVSEEIKQLGAWWHYLESTWIVKSSTLNADSMFAKLEKHISGGDRVLIIKVDKNDKQGWLPQDAWDWINED